MYRDKKLAIRYFITAFAVSFLSITLVLTFILATAMPTEIVEKKVYNNMENQPIYLPSNEDKLTIIMLISTKKENTPFVASLISIDPVMGYVPIITLPVELTLETESSTKTLEQIYIKQGGEAVKQALGKFFGEPIDRYIIVDKETLAGIGDFSGPINIKMPVDITIMNSISIKKGQQTIDSLGASEIIEVASYNLEYEDMSKVISEIISGGVNNLLKVFSSTKGEAAFKYIANNTTTDISFIDYTKRVAVAKFLKGISENTAKSLVAEIYFDENDNLFLKESYKKLISEMLRDKN